MTPTGISCGNPGTSIHARLFSGTTAYTRGAFGSGAPIAKQTPWSISASTGTSGASTIPWAGGSGCEPADPHRDGTGSRDGRLRALRLEVLRFRRPHLDRLGAPAPVPEPFPPARRPARPLHR